MHTVETIRRIGSRVFVASTVVVFATIGTGCAAGSTGEGSGGGGGAPDQSATISCADLANYIAVNITLANRASMEPLMAELVHCSNLSSDEARQLLSNSLSNQADVDAIITAVSP